MMAGRSTAMLFGESCCSEEDSKHSWLHELLLVQTYQVGAGKAMNCAPYQNHMLCFRAMV